MTVYYGRFTDLEIHGPSTLAGQRPCGFDKGPSLVVK